MITINDNAYIIADGLCYELFTKKQIEEVIITGGNPDAKTIGEKNKGTKREKTGNYTYKFEGGRYYSNLDNALNGYLNEYLLKLAADDTKYDLKEIINQIRLLKAELYMQFNLVTNHTSPIDNIRMIK